MLYALITIVFFLVTLPPSGVLVLLQKSPSEKVI